jgi:Ricin-type beta-trefoil lectin domain
MSVASVRMAAGSVACLLTLLVAPAFIAKAWAQGYQAALQISPLGGGHCIEVPNRDFVQDQGLQMADCNGSAAQNFNYDPASMQLTIGGLCVDANGGQPGALVKLRPCAAGANQSWKSEPKGNFTKLVGQNGLCLDIQFGSKASGAPLQSWNCGDSEPNQLWSLQRE